MEEQSTTFLDLLNNALKASETITASYFQGQAAKESAKVKAAINESTQETDNQTKLSANMTRNILLIVGGTLGLILVYQTAKRVLK